MDHQKCDNHYRLDGLSMVEDSLEILNMAINRWKAITGHLFDSSRPNSLTRVDDVAAKEFEELEYEKYDNLWHIKCNNCQIDKEFFLHWQAQIERTQKFH